MPFEFRRAGKAIKPIERNNMTKEEYRAGRLELGLSQEAYGQLAGVSRNTISTRETVDGQVSIEAEAKMCELLREHGKGEL